MLNSEDIENIQKEETSIINEKWGEHICLNPVHHVPDEKINNQRIHKFHLNLKKWSREWQSRLISKEKLAEIWEKSWDIKDIEQRRTNNFRQWEHDLNFMQNISDILNNLD